MAGQPQFPGAGEDRRAIDPGAVVRDLDEDAPGPMGGGQPQVAGLRFAARPSLLGGLQPVVHRVTQQVGQGIGHQFDQALVQFRLLPGELEVDLLAQGQRQVVDQPWKAVEDETDREHPDPQHLPLQLARVTFQLDHALAQGLPRGTLGIGRQALQHGLGDDQFADQIDQGIDLLGTDPDGFVEPASSRLPARFTFRSTTLRGGLIDGVGTRAAFALRRRDPGLVLPSAFGGRGGTLREGLKRQSALVGDPLEDLTQGGLPRVGRQFQGPSEITLRRLQLGQGRQGLGLGMDPQGPEARQFPKHQEHVVAPAEQVPGWSEADAPSRGRRERRRFAWQHQPGRDRRCLFGCGRFGRGRCARTGDPIGQGHCRQGIEGPIGNGQQLGPRLAAGAQDIEHGARPIDPLEQDLDRRRVQGVSTLSYLIQQGLQTVCEAGEVGEAEGGAAALHGMGGTKQGVDHILVDNGPGGLDQGRLHGVQFLEALLEEDLLELAEINTHRSALKGSTRRRVASRRSGSNGLIIQPVAPAARPSCFCAAEPSVVSVRIGIWRYSGSARRARIRVNPSISGMLMSVMTRVKCSRWARARASRPSPAQLT